jgi:hypothetical protein
MNSVFPDSGTIEGAEVLFRAYSAVAWALRPRFVDIRNACDAEGDEISWQWVVREIEKALFSHYPATTREADCWVDDMRARLKVLASGPVFRDLPRLISIVTELVDAIAQPEALDVPAQIAQLSRDGHALAGQLMALPEWASDLVRARWSVCPVLNVTPVLRSGERIRSIRPVTRLAQDRQRPEGTIELQVESSPAEFAREGTLFTFLTLDFQFLHEYLSHVLPVWISASARLEEVFLYAVAHLFNRDMRAPRDGIQPFLVILADEQRVDTQYRDSRRGVEVNLATALGAPELGLVIIQIVTKWSGTNMAKHINRSKLLEGALRLGTFTVREVMDVAGVANRQSAYRVVREMAERGYVTATDSVRGGAHRPSERYQVTDVPETRLALARELSSYRAPGPGDSDAVVNGLLDAARTALRGVEDGLTEIGATGHSRDRTQIERGLEKLRSLDPQLESARIDLESALLETPGHETADSTPTNPVVGETARWRHLKQRRDTLEQDFQQRLAELARAALLRQSLQAIGNVGFRHVSKLRIPHLRQTLLEAHAISRPAVEAFLDSLEADLESPASVGADLLERALGTHDLQIVRLCLNQGLKRNGIGDVPGWRYNHLTTKFLSTGTSGDWWACWHEFKTSLPANRPHWQTPKSWGPLCLYRCASDDLTEKAYVELAARHQVSLVASRSIGFLAIEEEAIEPTLVDIARLVMADSTAWTVAGGRELKVPSMSQQPALWRLYGYGPVVSRVRSLPGAPSLRVAGALHTFGLEDTNIRAALSAVEEKQDALILVQFKQPRTTDALVNEVRHVIASADLIGAARQSNPASKVQAARVIR